MSIILAVKKIFLRTGRKKKIGAQRLTTVNNKSCTKTTIKHKKAS